MIQKFEKLEQKVMHSSGILDFCDYKMKTPDGRIVHYDMMRHKGASAVIPVTDEGKILMVRQYRAAIDQITLEIPAGGRDSLEESFRTTAMRELEEETGFRCGQLEHLITIIPAVAYCDEKIEVYVARELVSAKQDLDEDEFIDIEEYDLEELKKMIFSAEIIDSKSVASIMAYSEWIRNR